MPIPSKSKNSNPLTNYAYYSNIAIEMGVIIAIGVFGGVKLDKWLDKSPLFTLICTLSSIAIALYTIIKRVTQQDKKEKNKHE